MLRKKTYSTAIYLASNWGASRSQRVLVRIYESGELSIISRCMSSHPLHANNLRVIKQEFEGLSHRDVCIKNALFSTFNSFKHRSLAPSSHAKRLKIAVCVSGHARGFEKAFPSWSKLFNASHEVDYYCALWNGVGRKPMTRTHLQRHFEREFIDLYNSDTDGREQASNLRRYKSLYKLFENDQLLNVDKVQSLYKPVNMIIHNAEDFSSRSGMYCMLYMIQQAFELIENPGNYDLVIRLRPDKEVSNADVDWNLLHEQCLADKLFCDSRPAQVHYQGILAIGDQFAVSIPAVIKHYCTTFSKTQTQNYPYNRFPMGSHISHMQLALSLLSKNVEVNEIPPSFVSWGGLLDASRISNSQILQAIMNCDLSDTTKERYAQILGMD